MGPRLIKRTVTTEYLDEGESLGALEEEEQDEDEEDEEDDEESDAAPAPQRALGRGPRRRR